MLIGAYLSNSIRKILNKKLITNHLNKNHFFYLKPNFLCNVKKGEWNSFIDRMDETIKATVFYIFMNDCTNKLTNEKEKEVIFSLLKIEWKIFLLFYRNLKKMWLFHDEAHYYSKPINVKWMKAKEQTQTKTMNYKNLIFK